MVTREEILSFLESVRGKYDDDLINKYYETINSLDDVTLNELIVSENLKTKGHLRRLAKKKLGKKSKFTKLNELVSYGITSDTLHIHVVPKDLHDKLTIRGVKEIELRLIDALELLKEKLQDKRYRNVKKIFAGSYIITGGVATMLRKLGFDVKSMDFEEAKKDKELSWLCRRFKDKNPKKMGRAQMWKEQLLSPEWNELVQSRKKKLRESLGLDEKLGGSEKQGILSDLQRKTQGINEQYNLDSNSGREDLDGDIPEL